MPEEIIPPTVDDARRRAGLSARDLWTRYVAVGGSATPSEIQSALRGQQPLPSIEHDMLAVAVNERLHEIGGDSPLSYRRD